MLRNISLVFFILCNFLSLSGQKIISDTIFIQFEPIELISSNYYIDTIHDYRKTHSRVVSYSQKKKYLLIPIDQEICLNKPLAFYLQQTLQEPSKDTVSLDINNFIIEKYQGRFFNQYRLYADIPFYIIKNGSPEFKGTFIYNFEYQPRKRKTENHKAIEELLPHWHQQFKVDLLATSSYLQNGMNKPDVFLEKKIKKPYYLNFSIGSVLSYNFWQVEGELFLNRPETSNSGWFMSNIVRYQKNTKFESFSYGKKSEHYFKRINKNWNIDITSNILIGFARFSNDEEIKLYQLLQASASSTQCIEFNKKNCSGFLLKAGLFENFYYIFKNPGLQAGVYFSAGYKF
jgi:hypothetical protein